MAGKTATLNPKKYLYKFRAWCFGGLEEKDFAKFSITPLPEEQNEQLSTPNYRASFTATKRIPVYLKVLSISLYCFFPPCVSEDNSLPHQILMSNM